MTWPSSRRPLSRSSYRSRSSRRAASLTSAGCSCERPLHVESLGGSILLAAHRLGVYKPTIYLSFANSWDLAGPAAKVVAVVGSLVEAAALLAVWFLFARGPRGPRELLLAVAAAVVGFVAFGKVLSPQYLVWVAAAVPLALGRVRPFALSATLAAALLTHYVYTGATTTCWRPGGRAGSCSREMSSWSRSSARCSSSWRRGGAPARLRRQTPHTTERHRAAVTRTSPASKRNALPTTRTWKRCLQAGEPQPPVARQSSRACGSASVRLIGAELTMRSGDVSLSASPASRLTM